MPVPLTRQQAQAERARRYEAAALLRSGGDEERADRIEHEADVLFGTGEDCPLGILRQPIDPAIVRTATLRRTGQRALVRGWIEREAWIGICLANDYHNRQQDLRP